MKREEMNAKVKELKGQAKGKIEAAPLPAFFIGIVIGVIFADYKDSIIPLLLISAFVYFGFWLLADYNKPDSTETDETTEVIK